jgi:predicted component of type VI protein secretion system
MNLHLKFLRNVHPHSGISDDCGTVPASLKPRGAYYSMPKLIFISPDFAGKTYKLSLEKTTIGRSDANVLAIRHDSVSSRHCEILVHGREVIVRDRDSSNGTFVDGVRLRNQQTAVKSGQTIRFGAVEALLEINPFNPLEQHTDMTAIVTHARAMRDQRRARANPPADPAATVESGTGQPAASSRFTILIPNEQGAKTL